MTARAFPAVLLGGDSTVAACPAHETPMSGWGAHLGAPLNMYLGWYIKNAIDAEPLLDDTGKPRRAFVKDQPIKSYTLLKLGTSASSRIARS